MRLTSATTAALGALLASLTLTAAANTTTVTASSNAGSPTSELFPPSGTVVNATLFPPEPVVGFPGPTPTGVEPKAIQSAPAYPYNNRPAGSFPLITVRPRGNDLSSTFDITKYWGNLSPWYSLSSADYGLPNASPLIPAGCTITQLHLLYRHGARYPTTGALPGTFAAKVVNASRAGFVVWDELAFLGTWKYQLGAELLTPFGRSQSFELGVAYRQLYGQLLNNFTASKTLPVFRTQSQDRMVKTAENFAAGFFGVPEYLNQVSIEILVETPGLNNSGAPYEICNNSNVATRGSIGSAAATKFANNAFNATLARLNSQVSGALNFTPTDAVSMLELCSYETQALGYSPFCGLFTEQDFINYEYFFDISFYYNNGPGSPVAAAQGKGYLQEFVARFAQHYPDATSALNITFDNTTTYFPLNNSFYADATHEVVVLDALTAFNLTALFKGPPLDPTGDQKRNSFVASKLVAFSTHFTVQVIECPQKTPTKQIRFIVNDAVVPISDSYPGCPVDPDGLCPFDIVVPILVKRINEIDFNYDCFGNYTASPGNNYNGRAPRS